MRDRRCIRFTVPSPADRGAHGPLAAPIGAASGPHAFIPVSTARVCRSNRPWSLHSIVHVHPGNPSPRSPYPLSG